MNSSTNFDTINLESLDEWLEDDLLQSGIVLADKPINSIPSTLVTPSQVLMSSPPISECNPSMSPSIETPVPLTKYEPLSPITPKIVPQEVTKTTTQPSIDLQPFIKALALLGSLQNQQNSNSNTTLCKRERSEVEDEASTEDIIALKRQRNTDAARRSRLRKALKMESLEKRVTDLETENKKLKLRATIAESERAGFEAKEKNNKVRILELEKQLAETHKALLTYTYKDTAFTTVKV